MAHPTNRKWFITQVRNTWDFCRVNPLKSLGWTNPLTSRGMNHQVGQHVLMFPLEVILPTLLTSPDHPTYHPTIPSMYHPSQKQHPIPSDLIFHILIAINSDYHPSEITTCNAWNFQGGVTTWNSRKYSSPLTPKNFENHIISSCLLHFVCLFRISWFGPLCAESKETMKWIFSHIGFQTWIWRGLITS